MTKEALLEGILKLPTIKIGSVAEDNQIIEGNQGNVHYKMTREVIPILADLTLFSLSTSGPEAERLAFINEVSEKLGKPFAVEEMPDLPGIYFAFWEASLVERRLKT
jgi:hypothetical protein